MPFVDYPGNGTGAFNITQLYAINNAGDATDFEQDSQGNQAYFILHNGVFSSPNPAGSIFTYYDNVSEAGQVATVYVDSGGNIHGALYDVNAAAFTLLPDVPGANGTFANSVATNGDVVDQYIDGNGVFQSAIYDPGTDKFTFLHFAAATNGVFATSLTASGFLGGYYEDSNFDTHGFIYDTNTGTWYTLDYPGAPLTELSYGNDSNQFAGYYEDATGANHSLVVNVVPEPASLGLLAAGLGAGLVALRRARRLSTSLPLAD